VEEVGDTAGAGNGDVEALVALTSPAFAKFETAGLDVEEVGRDDPGWGKAFLLLVSWRRMDRRGSC